MIRQELDTDRVERYIEAPPEALYDVIADVTRTPELSPELKSCAWVRGATGPAVGARFRARDKSPGRRGGPGRRPGRRAARASVPGTRFRVGRLGPTRRSSPSPIAAGSSRSPARS